MPQASQALDLPACGTGFANELYDLLFDLAADRANGWSIGTFGAIGEFRCVADERMSVAHRAGGVEILTARGGMRIAPTVVLRPVAWDYLSSDGQSWGHMLAFCVKRSIEDSPFIEYLGVDVAALRKRDRGAALFDLGVAAGTTRMCIRATGSCLKTVLKRACGRLLQESPDLLAEIMREQPHRILLSPAGRIEVFQSIPPVNGISPIGPHTHLLFKLAVSRRLHAATAPIPPGWQSVLTLHPLSPWRTPLGERRPFDPAADQAFASLLHRFGQPVEAGLAADIIEAISQGLPPAEFDWPKTRRLRAKGRIVLRRLQVQGNRDVSEWRRLHDGFGRVP